MKPKRNALGQFASRKRRKVANPEHADSHGYAATDAEIRRHVAREASTARGHKGLAIAHRQTAQTMTMRRWHGWADYHYRMADAHDAMAHSLTGVASARRR